MDTVFVLKILDNKQQTNTQLGKLGIYLFFYVKVVVKIEKNDWNNVGSLLLKGQNETE